LPITGLADGTGDRRRLVMLLLAAMISSTYYWIRNKSILSRATSLWSHFDNLGPRTTVRLILLRDGIMD